MKKCPNCGAQVKDDSLFCTECGKPIPQGSVCPHCGASVGAGDAFCQSCGKSLNEAPNGESVVNEEEVSKSGFQKYLPYIIGAVVVLALIGYFISNDSNAASNLNNKEVQTTDSVFEKDEAKTLESGADYTEDEIKNCLELMYKEMFASNANEDYDAKYTSTDYQSLLNKAYEVSTGDIVLSYDHWIQAQDCDKPSMSVISIKKESDTKAVAKINIQQFQGNDDGSSVRLILLFENGKWVVDDFLTVFEGEELSEKDYLKQYIKEAQSEPKDDDTSEYVENTIDSNYAEYVGRWSYYISSGGQRLKVYTAVIKDDNTAKFITFMPDGSLNTSIDFRQCVFTNGFVFFTDNGDINIKGTPRFKLGSGGLQTTDGERLTKE